MDITRTLYLCDLFARSACALYGVAGNRPLPRSLPPLPAGMEPSITTLYAGEGTSCPVIPLLPKYARWPVPDSEPDKGRFVVGATGGKDSLAVALKLISEGMRGTFLHVRGINPVYPHEAKAAQRQALKLGCGYGEVWVDIGRKSYLENPARNHALLLLQVGAACHLKYGVVVQGLHSNRVAATQPFETGWSDCVEMARAGRLMAQNIAPWCDNRIDGLPQSDTESIDYIFEHAPDLLPTVQSCMMPLRGHFRVRASACKRAGYDLLPGRCGICYKCIREWLVLRQHGHYAPSQEYEDHALKLLKDKHAAFCYGAAAANWSMEELLARFLSRPSKVG